MWYLKFSRRMTDPGAGSEHADSTSGPTQSFRNVTSLFRSFLSSTATGAREYLGFGLPIKIKTILSIKALSYFHMKHDARQKGMNDSKLNRVFDSF